MTTKDANKWLERVYDAIHNIKRIHVECTKNPELWESFSGACELNMGYEDFTYVIFEALVGYKNLVKDKIDNTEVKFFE